MIKKIFINSWIFSKKGIGYNQTADNETLVIDGAGKKTKKWMIDFYDLYLDYIVPPQENNALFLMTNFIRTDQEHRRCPGIYNSNKK